ncbi:MAG TPA: YceI family protein [Lacibacter sp.]|nr:YceI family protein [Lacibacter sp.]
MKQFFLSVVAVGSMVALAAFIPKENQETIQPLSANVQTPTKWTLDKSHSNLKFTVTHMVVSETEGSFKIFDGTVEHTKADMSDAKINFSVDMNSINTENENRDKHLKGDDFFNAEKYPTATFVGKSFKPLGDN